MFHWQPSSAQAAGSFCGHHGADDPLLAMTSSIHRHRSFGVPAVGAEDSTRSRHRILFNTSQMQGKVLALPEDIHPVTLHLLEAPGTQASGCQFEPGFMPVSCGLGGEGSSFRTAPDAISGVLVARSSCGFGGSIYLALAAHLASASAALCFR